MRQLVQIKKILDDTHAEIFMERPSACGGQLPRLWRLRRRSEACGDCHCGQ